jgi:hypothetical protein
MAVLTTIQTAIKTKLESLEYFAGISVFTEQLADVEQNLQIALAQKTGIAAIVLTPGADCNHPNLPGPYFETIAVVVQIVVDQLGKVVDARVQGGSSANDCLIEQSIKYARSRKPFGEALAKNQAIQFPLVELQTEAEMLRLLIWKTAAEMDTMTKPEVAVRLSDKVSMCNYRANRLCCEAADFAMQVHGGLGYSRHKQFEHIYRHHRRYRITEGSEQIQMRKVAGHMFGFMGG